MKVLFDSSVLIALIVKKHPAYQEASEAYKDFSDKNADFFVTTHSLAEVFRNLSWGVGYLNYSSTEAYEIIKKTILPVFKRINLIESDYLEVLSYMKQKNLTGSIVYDALIARASQKADADALLTFNIKDFRRVSTLTKAKLIVP